jgi:hypothetical protein
MKVIRSYKGKGEKTIQAFIQPGTSHYKLQYEGGGELPAELNGAYTSLNIVDRAVLAWLGKHKEEQKLNEAEKAKERYLKKQAKLDGKEE